MTAIQKTARMSSANSAHQPDRDERREQRADGVERLPQAEGAAADLGRGFVGDHRVARRPANALADAVGEARAPSPPARSSASGNSGLDSAARP